MSQEVEFAATEAMALKSTISLTLACQCFLWFPQYSCNAYCRQI